MPNEYITTRFGRKPAETVVGWAVVGGAFFGAAGTAFAYWILGWSC